MSSVDKKKKKKDKTKTSQLLSIGKRHTKVKVNNDDEDSSLLNDNISDNGESFEYLSSSNLYEDVVSKTKSDILLYSICLYINALLLEGPLGAIEGIVRFAIFIPIGIILFLISLKFCKISSYRKFSLLLIKEGVISLFASSTLIIPFMSWFVYRNYNRDPDSIWDLSTIPSFIGWIDSRRFISFTYGHGSLANNVKNINSNNNNNNIPSNAITEINGKKYILFSYIIGSIKDIKDESLSCGFDNTILCAPRIVSSAFAIISGLEDIEDIYYDLNNNISSSIDIDPSGDFNNV